MNDSLRILREVKFKIKKPDPYSEPGCHFNKVLYLNLRLTQPYLHQPEQPLQLFVQRFYFLHQNPTT